MLIVMGPVGGVSAADLFAAAVLPGLMLSGLFIAWALVRRWLNPNLGPALPVELRPQSMGPVIRDLAIGVMAVIVVILSTLGVILVGIATPTDAGAVGAFCTFVLTVGSGCMSTQLDRVGVFATWAATSSRRRC